MNQLLSNKSTQALYLTEDNDIQVFINQITSSKIL